MRGHCGSRFPWDRFNDLLNRHPLTSSPDRPPVHRCERSSPVKNRMLEIGAYGGEAGNILTYSAFEATAFQAVECSLYCWLEPHCPCKFYSLLGLHSTQSELGSTRWLPLTALPTGSESYQAAAN